MLGVLNNINLKFERHNILLNSLIVIRILASDVGWHLTNQSQIDLQQFAL